MGPKCPRVLVCGSVTPVEQGKHPFTTVLAARARPRSENFLPTDSCSSLSSSFAFPSSDSDSEGDNPEKKKLQEQLMGKRLEPRGNGRGTWGWAPGRRLCLPPQVLS